MKPPAPIVPLAGVFGGGGLFGIGYAMGVIDGLRSRGIDLTGCPMLGTSAGSWAAAATALAIPFIELISLDVPKFPNPRPGILAASAREVFGDATSSTNVATAPIIPIIVFLPSNQAEIEPILFSYF